MTLERIARHKARREKLEVLRECREEIEPYRVCSAPILDIPSGSNQLDNDSLGQFLREQQQDIDKFNTPITISAQEVDTLVMELRSRWNEHQLNLLLENCRNSVLNSVIGPFGVGTIVAGLDKKGGNVTTVHNAKQDIYAKSVDKYCRDDYAGSAYEKAHDQYKDGKILENSQMVQDEYTGNYLDHSQVECDHIKPTKKYHQEGGFMQDRETREKFGSDPGNFAMTSRRGNRSLQDKNKKEWQEKIATDGSGRTNKEVHDHDNRRVNAAIERGNKTAEKYAPIMTEKATYYGKCAAITGVQEAGRMGCQQAIGLLLTEFFSATFDEISDSYNTGFRDSLKNNTFFEALRTRLTRICERIAVRWKDAATVFFQGAISGFLSNLVTMLINMLITTAKRIVRVIREGFMSIIKALKMALFPPEEMTAAEASDAALKLLATGITVSLGILAEEMVEKSISMFLSANIPPLAPLASTMSTVFVGVMTGIVSAILVYGLDKLDVFGVANERSHVFVLQELDNLIAASDCNIETLYQDEIGRMDAVLERLHGR